MPGADGIIKQSNDYSEAVIIGQIVAPHGIRGKVKLRCFTEKPEDISGFDQVFDDSGNLYTLVMHSSKQNYAIFSSPQITTRQHAEALRDTKLYIHRQQLAPLPAGRYYHCDLIGMQVYHRNAAYIGVVDAVDNFGASDLLHIVADNGSTFYYPLLSQFVYHVDLPSSRIILLPAAGMLPDSVVLRQPIIIAVDGPSASGKGTISAHVASYFNLDNLDTGMMYRRLAFAVQSNGISIDDVDGIAALVKMATQNTSDQYLRREERIGTLASQISQIKEIRALLDVHQVMFPLGKKGAVLDGRDIGSVIFPQATCKLYIHASLDARAQRRFAQQDSQQTALTLENIKEKLQERDYRDKTRDVSPLVVAEDALCIDTSFLSTQQACDLAVAEVQACLAKINSDNQKSA